jgi:hypothetical protein
VRSCFVVAIGALSRNRRATTISVAQPAISMDDLLAYVYRLLYYLIFVIILIFYLCVCNRINEYCVLTFYYYLSIRFYVTDSGDLFALHTENGNNIKYMFICLYV